MSCSLFLSVRTSNTAFKETLKQIEGSSDCGGLPMISFLILPMQRVTRLPLLLDVSLTFTLLPTYSCPHKTSYLFTVACCKSNTSNCLITHQWVLGQQAENYFICSQ